MTFEQIIFEEKDQIAWITLNRPKVFNALSMRLSDELVEIFGQIESLPKISREIQI